MAHAVDMVERAARAICLDAGFDWDALPLGQGDWTVAHLKRHGIDYVHGPFRSDYLDAAKAAIAAIWEPTRDMVEAGEAAIEADLSVSEAWGRMIVVALDTPAPAHSEAS